MSWPVGKIPWEALSGLLRPSRDAVLLQGPGLGQDAAVLNLGDHLLVTATDPVTFATDRVGSYSVWVNANDVAVCGARPRWFQAVLLLPEGAHEELLAAIMGQIQDALEDLGAVLVGGHTEVVMGLSRPIVIGQMIGEVTVSGGGAGPKALSSAGARPGDKVLLAGHLALEATALLAVELRSHLTESGFGTDDLDAAAGLLDSPGISVVEAALAAAHTGKTTAAHDVTEGGLAQAAWEMTTASGVGMEIDFDRVPRLALTERICRAVGVDPLGAIGSGGLLLTCRPEHVLEVLWAVRLNGTRCEEIGEVTKSGRVELLGPDGNATMPRFQRDEVARVLSGRLD